MAEFSAHCLDGAAGVACGVSWWLWAGVRVAATCDRGGCLWWAAQYIEEVVVHVQVIESVYSAESTASRGIVLGLLRFWVAGYFPSEWLTGCTRHVASPTNIFATMLRPGGKRADSTGVQTLPAGPDLVFTVAGADLVLIGCSIRTNSQPRASDTWPRARHTILVAIFPALLTSAAVVRGILAVLERAYEPLLSFANILAV